MTVSPNEPLMASELAVTLATLVLELIAVLAFTFDGRRSVLRAV